MAKIASKPKSKLDRIREVSPRYADLIARHRDLADRHEVVLAEIAPLSEQQRRSQVSWTTQLPRPKPKPIERHAGGLSLVDDLLPEQPPEEIRPAPVRQAWPGEDRLRELGNESESIAAALDLLSPEISKARKEYSKKVAEQDGDEFQEIVGRIVDAAKTLGDALIAHHGFINQQRLDGVSWRYFLPLNLERFGNLDEPFSPLLALITDAVEKRHVGVDQIPDWKMPVDLAYLQVGP